jgi:hypothetical protein
MKLTCGIYLFLILSLSGCSGTKTQETRLYSGSSVEILSITAMHFSNGPPSLMLKYQTRKSIQDTDALRKEAGEVWDKFRPQVEKQGFRNAVLSANDSPKGLILTSTSTYNFVFDQRSDGSWHCSFDDKKPAT